MRPDGRKRELVQSISLSRLLAGLLFASMAFQGVPTVALASLYIAAMCSDLLDGFLARRLNVESFGGKVLDLVSDKSLTVVSLLYAAARGMSVLPLAVIATREIVMIGLRLVTVDGNQLLPTNRIFGGVLSALLWGNTLLLIVTPKTGSMMWAVDMTYCACAVVLAVNLILRVRSSTERIRITLQKGA